MLKTANFKKIKENNLINHVDYYVERVKEIPEGERYEYYVSNYLMKDEVKVLQDFKDSDRDWKDFEFKVRRRKWYDFVRRNFVEKRVDFKCFGHYHSWVLNPAYENEVNEFFDLNYVNENYCVRQRLFCLYFNPRTSVVSKKEEKGSILVPDYIDQEVNEELMVHGYLPYRMTYEQFLEVRDAEKAFLARSCSHGALQMERVKSVHHQRQKKNDSNVGEVMKTQKDQGRQRFKKKRSAVKPKVSLGKTNVQRGENKLRRSELNEVSLPTLSYAETQIESWSEEEVAESAYTFPIEEVAVMTSQINPCCGEIIMFDVKIQKRGLTQKIEKNERKEEESSTGVPALKVIGFVSRSRPFEKKKEEGPIFSFEKNKEERWSRGTWKWSLIKKKFILDKVISSFRTDELPVLKNVNDRPRCHLGNQVERLLLSKRVCVLL